MSNKVAVIALGAVLTGLLVGVVLAGSGGGGDSASTDVEPPELTVPGGSDFTGERRNRQDEGTTNDSGTTDSGGAATPAPDAAPDSGGAAPAQPEDTQRNDAPPPSGSPAQRFEQFCEENPGAC